MFSYAQLKPLRPIGPGTVPCPVSGCATIVERARRVLRREERFLCPIHQIYVSPSTYEHVDYKDNLLPCATEDPALLRSIIRGKREVHRMGRERSEDAFTLNVFRTLDRNHLVTEIASDWSGRPEQRVTPMYWSLLPGDGGPHPLLTEAHRSFREAENRGTEPDLLIKTAETLILVETKLGSPHATTPSRDDVLDLYRLAAGGWYTRVFRTEPDVLATRLKLYQLMRLWLLGTWMAAQAGKRFLLVSLTLSAAEADIQQRFSPHVVLVDGRRFVRATWDSVRDAVRGKVLVQPSNAELQSLAAYLDGKTMGYDASGRLQRAL